MNYSHPSWANVASCISQRCMGIFWKWCISWVLWYDLCINCSTSVYRKLHKICL